MKKKIIENTKGYYCVFFFLWINKVFILRAVPVCVCVIVIIAGGDWEREVSGDSSSIVV